MLKSMYSGVSGMKAQQTKMDVIANNIANVGTTGFKSGRVRFEDMISEITSSAQGASTNLGGINAQQVGMGVQVSGTDTIMTGGSLQATGRSLDFGIQNGDNSFFVVSDTGNSNPVESANHRFTRDGGFFVDVQDNLVTPTGMRVMGYPANTSPQVTDGSTNHLVDATGNLEVIKIPKTRTEGGVTYDLQSYNIDNTGHVYGVYSDGNTYVLGRVALASFSNPEGLEKQGGNLYQATANSGVAASGAPSETGFGTIRSGFLEMSNVDLANEFTDMIVTSRAYQANSRAITTSDEMLQELINLKR